MSEILTPDPSYVRGTGALSAPTVRLTPDQLQELATLLADQLRAPDEDRWYKTRAAAAYLGMHRGTLRTLAAERRIRFEQERPGTTLRFKGSLLDEHLRGAPA
jgi:excisionase family DNA binding protein